MQRLGRDYHRVGEELATEFAAQRNTWMAGEPSDWALEAFGKARDVAYRLGSQVPDERSQPCFELTPQYEDTALTTVREQLAKAGMRLALILNQTLRRQ